ncbi:hypothetical protein OJ996_21340 [Luteolibacter sp. GHJ8]|uniref:Nucleotidyltransferase-like protein n=1 Tax=Luteolibacter rhizosphaerae TaxID=2989719 RepID=A0ABT3G8H2_9BACT|nr:hypothetical protein [Luteolibacter rhizosphaerae]MCW1916148.1 hypothetical protein [Luteolibacter rhizosphaerae]
MEAVCDVLEELLKQGSLSAYAIGGATAAGFHGEPLATRDIDVFVFLEASPGSLLVSLSPLFERLSQMGFRDFDEEGILINGFPVQFLSATPGLETEAVTEALVIQFDTHVIRVMTPEHLAAIALKLGRPKDRARLVYLVSLPEFDRSRFGEVLSKHGLTERWDTWASGLGL